MVCGLGDAVGVILTASRPVASRKRDSRSKSAWYWLRMVISIIPISRPCLMRRLTLAWESLVILAISAWVMPSWKCITSTV
jgi:hypothetical protein